MPPHDRSADDPLLSLTPERHPVDGAEGVAVPRIDPPPAPEGSTVHTSPMFCKRCGETSHPVDHCCPWCGRWLVGAPPVVEPVYSDPEPEDDWHTDVVPRDKPKRQAPPPIHPGLVIGISYALLIGSLFVLFAMIVVQGVEKQEDVYGMLAVIEILDAVLAVTALALVWRTARQKLPKGTVLLTWVLAVPALAALLCLNIAYITFLRELFKPFGAQQPEHIQVTLVTVLLICLQPALVEELFFRQMILGVFRKWMNLHAAVWLTAGMFAFAHITNPLGMPYLLLGGALFGYARVFGGLPLAMILHLVHNFVVIAYEAWK